MGFKWIFITLLLTNIIAHGQSTLDSLINRFEPWRTDTSICKNSRDSLCYLLVSRESSQNILYGLNKRDLLSVLGKPDRKF